MYDNSCEVCFVRSLLVGIFSFCNVKHAFVTVMIL
jgi:hypothetical protein